MAGFDIVYCPRWAEPLASRKQVGTTCQVVRESGGLRTIEPIVPTLGIFT